MFESFKKNDENFFNKKISEIEPIEEWRGTEIKNREDLKNLIEGPLLTACQELYDKNIRTTGSSSNKKDLDSGFAYINIDFGTLSDENKEIGKNLGEIFDADELKQLQIKIPLDIESTFEDIQSKAEKISHQFVKQAYPVMTYTMDDVKNIYGIDVNDDSFEPGDFPEFYWSPEYKLFFLSEEQFKKATEDVNILKN